MTPAERARNVQTFRDAAKVAPKAQKKVAPKVTSTSKPKPPVSKPKPAVKAKPAEKKPAAVISTPKVAKSKKDMPYAGSFPGEPKKKTVKPKRKRNVRGTGAKNRRPRPSLAEGSEKTITVGSKRVRMIVKNGKWVRK